MKITPLEIRQKQFEKKLRGYDKDEVNAFLLTLSQEWEKVMDEKKELVIKLDASQKEVEKLREVESSLFKTLKTAEDTGANMIEQANKAAELHLKEAHTNSEALLNDAKLKARAMIEKAELETREIIEEMEDELKKMEHQYKAIENQRENLVTELKLLSHDITDKLERISKKSGEINIGPQIRKARELSRKKEEDYEASSHKKENTKNPVELSRPRRSPEPPKRKNSVAEDIPISSEKGNNAENRSEKKTREEPGITEVKNPREQSFFDELK